MHGFSKLGAIVRHLQLGFLQGVSKALDPTGTLCCHLVGTWCRSKIISEFLTWDPKSGSGMPTSEPPICHGVSGKFLTKEIESQVIEGVYRAWGLLDCKSLQPPQA